MSLFQTLAALISLAAVFSYVNYRLLRLPQTIALMAMGLATSLALLLAGWYEPAVFRTAQHLLSAIDFNEALLHGMLAFLLFAGALHVDLHELREHRLVVLTLSTVGVLISTFVVGGLMWLALRGPLGTPIPLSYCLLFGALISPTDPIAVLSMLKAHRAPRALAVQIAGESLFNDGVGVVVFLALLGFAGLGHVAGDAAGGTVAAAGDDVRHAALLFCRQAVGGAAYGIAIGLLAYRMLKRVDQYTVEILITLALVTGGYALAEVLRVSGPIAMVVAGLVIGNHGRAFAMSAVTREHLDLFWELVDEILNAVLFVLIGLEVLVIRWERTYLLAGIVAVVVVLAARLISVGGPILVLRRVAAVPPLPAHAVGLMTWGGLRGGISVALALSLRGPHDAPPDARVDAILVMTYVVVVFSIGVQGLTMGRVLRRAMAGAAGVDKVTR